MSGGEILSDDPLLNAKKQLEKLQNYCLVYKLELESIRITLDRARKTFMELKSKETSMLEVMENETKVLLRLQHNVDEYTTRCEEIVNKKRLLKETYESQLEAINSEEASLNANAKTLFII